jgi:hypothetical protein
LVITGRVRETEAQKQTYTLVMCGATPRKRMTEQEIRATADKLADVVWVLSEADADDKSENFRQLGLKLTNQPGRRTVYAR